MLPVWIDSFLETFETRMTLYCLIHVSIIGVKENVTLKGENIIQTGLHILVIA